MNHNLVYYGNKTLSSVAERVENIDDSIISLIKDMCDVLTKVGGLGLAAPQVDEGKRIVVAAPDNEKGAKIILINPEIKKFSDSLEEMEEGCLSVPDIFTEVKRPAEIIVKGVTPEGKEIEFEASGLTARIFQHEIDHLNGILFIDRIEKYIREEFRSDLKRIKKLSRKKH
ncbi:MAG: peptide deformylase [Spirochaetota bacterium]